MSLLTILKGGALSPSLNTNLIQRLISPILGFSPLSLSPTLWLDASDSSTISTETGVSNWADKSGNGNDVSQGVGASQPDYGSVTLNSKNTVTFDGSDDRLQALTSVINSAADELSLFAVITYPAHDGPETIVGTEFVAKICTSSLELLGFLSSADGTSWELFPVVVDGTAGLTGIVSVRLGINSTGYSLYWNGSEVAGNTTGFTGLGTNSNKFVVGGRGGADNYEGSVGEVLLYPTALTNAQRCTVHRYLANKWGL